MRVVTQLSHEVGHHSGCDGYSIFQLHTISNHHATVRQTTTNDKKSNYFCYTSSSFTFKVLIESLVFSQGSIYRSFYFFLCPEQVLRWA